MKNVLMACIMFVLFGLALNVVVKPVLAGPIADMRRESALVGRQAFDEGEGAGQTLPERVGKIIRSVLGLLGIILVVIVVYAGFLWMTAGGNEDQVKKARTWITNAVIGMVIILSAYAITDFVIAKLGEATGI